MYIKPVLGKQEPFEKGLPPSQFTSANAGSAGTLCAVAFYFIWLSIHEEQIPIFNYFFSFLHVKQHYCHVKCATRRTTITQEQVNTQTGLILPRNIDF